MALSNCTLGKYIELRQNTNDDLIYNSEDVRGVNNLKMLMPTKADINGRDLTKFQIVYPGEFVFNHRTSRNGSKFSIAYNNGNKPVICTEDYVVFRIKEDSKNYLLAEWLYMFFNRPEFDRYVITNSWGSSTEFYNWEDICAVRLNLPSLSVQQKYVDIYNAMVANQQAYERGLEDLKLVCDGYIEDLRRKMTLKSIGQYIRKEDKNSNEEIKKVVGIGQSGFIAPQKEPNKSLKNYKVIKKGDICYAPPLYNVLTGALHMYREEELAVCSPIYEVFFCDTKYLLPEYLTMWLKREEFKRYAEFYALGVRQTFDYSLVEQIKIPIPSLTIQKSLSILYDAYLQRQKINEKLKVQIKSICPILIKGSLEEK